jgi:hypothetical protein
MTTAVKRTGVEDLRRSWRRWTAVVELFALRRGARRRIGRAWYEALHAELLVSCRALAADGVESERPFYCALEVLAQPWLSPYALEQADREILFDLFHRCREAGRQLGCWTWADALRRRAGVLTTLALSGAGVVVAACTTGLWLPPLGRLVESWRPLWLAVKQAAPGQGWLVAGGAVVVLITLYLFTRGVRA